MNDRGHWSTRYKLTRAWREASAAAAHGLGRSPLKRGRGPCEVRVQFPVRDPGRRRDPHNTAPTVKAIVDGLVDASVWPDDTPEWVRVADPTFYKPDGDMLVRIHLVPLEAVPA